MQETAVGWPGVGWLWGREAQQHHGLYIPVQLDEGPGSPPKHHPRLVSNGAERNVGLGGTDQIFLYPVVVRLYLMQYDNEYSSLQYLCTGGTFGTFNPCYSSGIAFCDPYAVPPCLINLGRVGKRI